METILHKAETRGHLNHGWLNSIHTFSFSQYYNPERMHFGALRVLNDDIVTGGRGFDTHPHTNMEIISIPLQGDLKHTDSMGNVSIIKEGEIQAMSAGTGVYHTEYNHNKDEEVHFLQIWIYPNKRDVTPRYDQQAYTNTEQNTFQQILSPSPDDDGIWIYQNAWFLIGTFDTGREVNYQIKKAQNGVYVFVIEGSIMIDGQELNRRDGLGIWDTSSIKMTVSEEAKILLMDIPMEIN